MTDSNAILLEFNLLHETAENIFFIVLSHIGETKWMLTSKKRIYGLFLCFLVENFKAKTVDAFFLKSDLDPRQQSELSSDKILSNKSASFEKISLLAFRFFYKKTYTKFSRPFCLISRNVINDKTVFFYFSKKDVIPMWQIYY